MLPTLPLFFNQVTCHQSPPIRFLPGSSSPQPLLARPVSLLVLRGKVMDGHSQENEEFGMSFVSLEGCDWVLQSPELQNPGQQDQQPGVLSALSEILSRASSKRGI